MNRGEERLDPELPILPSTKVAALLDRYPQLEDVLINLAPPFRKLKNPLLRKGVARLASLQQAAAAAGLPTGELVNKLRAAVGQEAVNADEAGAEEAYFTAKPAWFDATKVVSTIDERAASDPDQMPIAGVLQKASLLREGAILELITAFIPAPGIGVLLKKGFQVWSVKDDTGAIRTYIRHGE